MSYSGRKKMSLDAASREARERGLIGDYFALDDHTKGELLRLMARTTWRQSASSANAGHSRTYAFHQALKRA